MISVIEMFAGIGAFRKALERQAVEHEVIGISEIDKYAIQSYNAIFGETKNYGDISKVLKFDYADMWTYGFPCQDISVAGKQAGIKRDTRSGLLYQVQRLLETAYQYNELPKYLIMENVKNLVGKKFRKDFDSWLEWLDELGYNNYWQVLNAKDYGIPQNRERVFCISIRKDIDNGKFEFPEKQELKLRLKDMLEDEVDERYYLKDIQIEKIQNSNFAQEAKRIQEKEYCDTLLARDYKDPKCVRIGGIFDSETQKHQAGAVWDKEGLAPTLDTMQGGWRQPSIIASRGRYKEDGTTQQHFELQESGLTNTITTVQKDNYLLEPKIEKVDIPQIVKVRKNPVDTEKLKKVLREHKNITNTVIATTLNKPQTLVEHWFRNDDCFAVPDADIWFKLKELLNIEIDEFDKSITEFEEREGVFEKSNRCYFENGISPTLTSTSADEKIIIDFRIRKLTPRETWRLMGFDDIDFDKAQASGVSNTQLYKQAGNSIVVNVLEEIIKNLGLPTHF